MAEAVCVCVCVFFLLVLLEVIPKEFAGKYLSDEVGSISIQTENGKKWSLLYKWSESDDEDAYISRGWRDFVEENLLKPGDVVFFELIKKDKFLFTKLQENITVPSSSPKNKTASTTNPFFEVQIHKKSYGNTVLVKIENRYIFFLHIF